jgi:hypothetical protein
VATLKRRPRRRGEGVPDGTAGEAAAVDLSHQTLAKPETRRGSAETGWCEAAAWRSGARRPDGAAGREPKGPAAGFRCFEEFAVRVSEPVTTPRHATPRHATPRHATQDSICCPHNFFRTLRCAYRGGVRQRRRRCPFRPSARRDDRVFAREQAAPQPRPIPLLTVSFPP